MFIGRGIGIPLGGRVSKPLWKQLQDMGNLTFFKDFTSAVSADADFASGSPTATFTASRSASNPATYIDGNGVIQVVTTSNTPRFNKKLYTPTGMVDGGGFILSPSQTNILTYSDGTLVTGNKWTNWDVTYKTVIGTPTLSLESQDLFNYAGSQAMRVVYNSVSGDSNMMVQVGASPLHAITSGYHNVSTYLKINSLTNAGSMSCGLQMNTADANNKSIGYLSVSFGALSGFTTDKWTRINGAINAQNRTATITSIVGNGTTATVTATAHNIPNGAMVSISGTTAFNGDTGKTITVVDANTFTYPSAVSATEGAGMATQYVAKSYFIIASISSIDYGDAFDMSFMCPQVTKTANPVSYIPSNATAGAMNNEDISFVTTSNFPSGDVSMFASVVATRSAYFGGNTDAHCPVIHDASAKRGLWMQVNGNATRYDMNNDTPLTVGSAMTPYVGRKVFLGFTGALTGSGNAVPYLDGVGSGGVSDTDSLSATLGATFKLGSASGIRSELLIRSVAIFDEVLTPSNVLNTYGVM
jgi:hypothetical protein